MLFYVGWKPRAGLGHEEQKEALALFARWKPPEGLEFHGFYGRADGQGFCVCDAGSAEALYSAVAPWAGVFNDYEVVPIIEINKGVELLNAAVAFRDS